MNKTHIALSLSLALALTASINSEIHAQTKAVQKMKASELSLEQLFRAKSYFGKTASLLQFSHDGRFLAYAWNPYGEEGSDLYLHDTVSGKTQRITSPSVMRKYDAPEDWDKFDKKLLQKEKELVERQAKAEAQAAYLRGEKVDLMQWENAAIEALKRELAEKKAKQAAQKAEKKNDKVGEAEASQQAGKNDKQEKEKEKELWELRDELKKKLAKEKLKNTDLYPGIENLVWAEHQQELVFQYRGDLFRLFAETGEIERLTKTDKVERILSYNADDSAYLYMDDKRIYAAPFKQGQLRQLNPEFIYGEEAEKKYLISSTRLSEDKQWMAITATAADPSKPPTQRQVEIMNYNERFATAKKVPREVSDDKRQNPPFAVYIRRVSDDSMRQPQAIFTHDGGDSWFEISRVQFSKDSQRYTFSTWEREQDLLRIYVGNTQDGQKPQVVYERKGQIGHEVVDVVAPRFSPDSQQLIAVLDEHEYRQPYRVDINTKTATPILKAGFEAHHILGFTPDSQYMYLLANRDDFASMNVFKVNMSNGDMQAIGQSKDYHRLSALSENASQLASVAGHWAQRPELKLFDLNDSKKKSVLTQSHDPQWDALHLLQAERFHFINRHGDRIEAYAFKPQNWSSSDRRPAIVYTYGGPLGDRHIIENDSFQPTAYIFGMYMAAKHGYVTVAVDPRGHSNYGRRFSDANWEQVGQPQTEDLEDLVKYMQKNLGIDSKRVGLTGWSFGGFQTQYTMYTKPDLFAAGIAGAGPTEWENYNSWYSGRTIGKVDRSKPVLRKYSLLPLSAGLKKPLLLVHGMLDPNVLYQDTVNVYRALLEHGKEALVDLFLDPDGEHGMGGAVKPKAWHKKYEAYFLQHLGRYGTNR